MNPKWLPTSFIIQYLICSIVYWSHGDWRRGVYWIAAAILTVTVTF